MARFKMFLVVLLSLSLGSLFVYAWATEDWEIMITMVVVESVLLVALFVLLLCLVCFAILDMLCLRPNPPAPTGTAHESIEMGDVDSKRTNLHSKMKTSAHLTNPVLKLQDAFDDMELD